MTDRWTSGEEKILVECFSNGDTFDTIANQLHKSPDAVKFRIEYIINREITAGKKLQQIALLLHKPSDVVAQLYYEYKKHMDQKYAPGQPKTDINVLSPARPNFLLILERENRIMEAIVKNHKLRKLLEQLQQNNALTKNDIYMLKELSK